MSDNATTENVTSEAVNSQTDTPEVVSGNDEDVEAPEAIQDHPDWQDGDFTLISSDGWRFKIPSVQLFAASIVLRDAQCDNNSKEIHFTDPDIESSRILAMFLGFISDTPCFDDDDPPGSMVDYPLFIEFLKKYDCPRVREFFEYHTASLLHSGVLSPINAFVAGSFFDHVNLCAQALLCRKSFQDIDTMEWKYEEHAFDVGNIPAHHLSAMPAEYVKALSQVREVERELTGPEAALNASKKFGEFLAFAKGQLEAAAERKR